jgi:hypothetical protein
MGELEDDFPNWDKPATKGDILEAMIWTQALVGSVFSALVASQSGGPESLAQAALKYDEEWKEYRRKVGEIAGKPLDG